VLVADCTFFKRNNGLCIFYAPKIKKVIAYSHIQTESKLVYMALKQKIEEQGFKILAVVIDGRSGIKNVFKGIPIQMCQFHQLSILRRYLTSNPRLEASKELKMICKNLCNDTKKEFEEKFKIWNNKWFDFLNEKTFNENGKWHYTHRRLRSSRRSIQTHIPNLFTYLEYPDLIIPNTTNHVESINSKIKEFTRIHRGFNMDLKHKIIKEILLK